MRLHDLSEASLALAATRSRLEKRDRLAALLVAAAPEERRAVVAWMSGVLLQRKIGVGYAEVSRLEVMQAPSATLEVGEVERYFDELAAVSGRGSTTRRRELLVALFIRATELEQGFLRRLLVGELRQGGQDGVMIEALAKATSLPAEQVRRAVMLAGDLPRVAALALGQGAAGLASIAVAVFTPLSPMLASPADDLAHALAEHGSALIEWKLDGARVQVHRDGEDVRVFTRALQDCTRSVPEVVEAALALPLGRFVLDGETLALNERGGPRPFQETLARFSTRVGVEAARATLPLSVFFFDVLLHGDELVLDRTLEERRALLTALVPATQRIPSIETTELSVAQAFYDGALKRGHEGVMVKALSAPYQAGARGSAWRKVKRIHTLDLVVLAAEWGSGRRRGWLSNLHLGARDGDGWVMLGKTFKGMTDETLAWQTEQLLARQTDRKGQAVHVRPELVVEVAFDEVQRSVQYEGGYALRFARVVRYRPDKTARQADTIDAVRAIFERSRG